MLDDAETNVLGGDAEVQMELHQEDAAEEHAQPTRLEPEEPENKPPAKEDNAEWRALRDARNEAQKAKNSIDNEVRDLERRRDDAQRITTMRVDGDMCLVQLGTECAEVYDHYRYRVCALDKAEQGATSLGRFEEWVGDERTPLAQQQMKFGHGANCPGKGDRTMLVTLSCGAQTRLRDVSEPSTCSYRAVLETPCACSQKDFDAAAAELAALTSVGDDD